jgi:ABC-type transporter Mla subunit MlaD
VAQAEALRSMGEVLEREKGENAVLRRALLQFRGTEAAIRDALTNVAKVSDDR